MGGINSTERTGPYQIRKITIMNPIRNIVMNLEPLPSDTYFSSRIRIKIGLFHREDDGGRKGGGKGIEIFFLAHLFVSVEGKLTRGIVLFDLSIFSSNNFYFFVSSFCRPVTFISFCLRPLFMIFVHVVWRRARVVCVVFLQYFLVGSSEQLASV